MKNLIPICGLMLLGFIAFASAQQISSYPTVSIYDVQYVPPESLATGQDNSQFLGDTITVEGVVANGPRSIWSGARWSLILVDEKGGPWNGLQIIQHDTSVAATNITAVKPGYKIRVTGFIEEFSYNVKPSQTQLALLVAPPVPVELVGFGYPIPGPTEVTCADLALGVGEKYECCQVIIKNATVINNAAPGNDMVIADATGQLNVDSWSNPLYDSLSTGKYRWPQNGTNINIKGYVRNNPNGIGLELAPMTSADITILTTPPLISNIVRQPAAPTSNDPVTVTAKIMDSNGTVSQALLHYRIGTTRWQTGNMTTADSIYSFTIPKLPDGTFVQYFIRAVDNVGDWSTLPGDTTTSRFFYTVRDQGLTIKDLQWTPFKDGNSGYMNMVVTVTGIVTASPDDILGDYMLQDKAEPWCGIWVNDAAHTPHRGDSVRVTATVEESFNLTRLNFVTKFDSLSTGHTIEPLKIKTGQARTGSPEAESYEGVLLEFDNVYVSDPFPDRPSNYGEIEINDGTGGYRVDENGTYLGNFDSTYALNDKFQKVIGVGWYSFNNYKLKPRSAEDIIGYQPSRVSQRDSRANLTYELKQNYPNPFNPATTIRYRIAKNGPVELVIYNMMGQKIRTLVKEVQSAGVHLAQWDGRNNQGQLVGSGVYFYSLKAGDFTHTRKMILLR
ncbi:MAG: T9SS type A sorting domain-containing protein [candidate division KSB1 bacterium]|nr:T9SS type A sorting domain-containing protein [candidate division KSB1 bacterium]MDZ7340550.1 T9SS type A sorting domain-containing protein [candidate division KSB1 bacterium]